MIFDGRAAMVLPTTRASATTNKQNLNDVAVAWTTHQQGEKIEQSTSAEITFCAAKTIANQLVKLLSTIVSPTSYTWASSKLHIALFLLPVTYSMGQITNGTLITHDSNIAEQLLLICSMRQRDS